MERCSFSTGDSLVLHFGGRTPDYERKLQALVAREADRIPPNMHTSSNNTGRERIRWFYEFLRQLQQTHPAETVADAQDQISDVLQAVEEIAISRKALNWTNADGTQVINGQKGCRQFTYYREKFKPPAPIRIDEQDGKYMVRKNPNSQQNIFVDNTHKEFIFFNNQGAIQICRKPDDHRRDSLIDLFRNRDLRAAGLSLDELYGRVVFDKPGKDGKDVWGNTPSFSSNPRSPYVADTWRVLPREQDPNIQRSHKR
jgi:hypothetical protein